MVTCNFTAVPEPPRGGAHTAPQVHNFFANGVVTSCKVVCRVFFSCWILCRCRARGPRHLDVGNQSCVDALGSRAQKSIPLHAPLPCVTGQHHCNRDQHLTAARLTSIGLHQQALEAFQQQNRDISMSSDTSQGTPSSPYTCHIQPWQCAHTFSDSKTVSWRPP